MLKIVTSDLKISSKEWDVTISPRTTVQSQLESPGARLPAFELAWLRIMFRCACRVISLHAGLRWFKFEARQIVALAGRAFAAQVTVPVLIDRVVGIEDSSRSWSVFMVLDHLRIVDEGITQIIETLTEDRLFVVSSATTCAIRTLGSDR